MHILVLGGTWFLGRCLINEALQRGHAVTAFTRGASGRPPQGAAHVLGDRHEPRDLERLSRYGPWDAAVDTSAYEPGDVAAVVSALAEAAGRYVLLSTVSAYRDWPERPVDERSPLWPSRIAAKETDPDIAALPERFQYGTLKAGCELAAQAAPNGSLILRPGVILGPGEYVGRCLSLLTRAQRGGRWLVPAPASQEIQPVDVRDVSRFIVDMLERGAFGAFNLTAPFGSMTYGDLISAAVGVTGNRAEPVWVDPQWLIDRQVGQWTEIPLWRTQQGVWAVDSALAQGLGFSCRPLLQTLADFWSTLQHEPLVDHERQREHGMDAEREAELLRQWSARS